MELLASCYYSPDFKRFDNADVIEGSISNSSTLNRYAYVNGKPVSMVDPKGEFAWVAAGAAIGAVIGGASSAITQLATTGHIDPGVLVTDTVSGAISGLLTSSGAGIFGAIAGNAAISGATYLVEQKVQGEEAKIDELIYSTFVGGSVGAIGGKGIKVSRMQGIWSTSEKVINTTQYLKKKAMYTAKKY